MSPCAPNLTCSSPGQGAPRVGQRRAQPPSPQHLCRSVAPPCSTRNTGLSSAAHLTRGKRKTNPQTQAQQPHTCHRFPWWIFPRPLSAEEPANLEKTGWGLGSCGLWPGWGVAGRASGQGWEWAAHGPTPFSYSLCCSLDKRQSPAGLRGPKTQF